MFERRNKKRKWNIANVNSNLNYAAANEITYITKCITKIDGATIHGAGDLDLVMPIYNLIEYSSNYSKTTGSLLFYSKDEATDFNADIVNDNNFKSFKYKAKLLGNTVAQADNAAKGILKNTTILCH